MKDRIRAARRLLWIWRFTLEFRRHLPDWPWQECWQVGATFLDDALEGDVDDMTPADAVIEEFSYWGE